MRVGEAESATGSGEVLHEDVDVLWACVSADTDSDGIQCHFLCHSRRQQYGGRPGGGGREGGGEGEGEEGEGGEGGRSDCYLQ